MRTQLRRLCSVLERAVAASVLGRSREAWASGVSGFKVILLPCSVVSGNVDIVKITACPIILRENL